MLPTCGTIRGISLAGILPEAEFLGAPDLRATSCASDWRVCRSGDLFISLAQSPEEAKRETLAAAARGASAVLTERPVPEAGLPMCIVRDSRTAYGEVCQALAGNPSRRLKTIGISGTSGKTTTSFLAASVLEAAGHGVGLLGTLGYSDGVEQAVADTTTPPPPMLAEWLARMDANGCSHAIVEVSGQARRGAGLAGVTLDGVAITNSRRAQAREHLSICGHLSPEGVAVLNADDQGSAQLFAEGDGPLLAVAINAPAEITAVVVEEGLSEQTFLLNIGNVTTPVRTHLIGRHNIYNCLTAAGIGFMYGVEPETIARGLEAVKRIPGRLERLECGQPFGVFVDAATTPERLTDALNTLRAVARGRVICVTGSATASQRADAIRGALVEARPGDCVLFAGLDKKETEQGEASVREIARQWLYHGDRPTLERAG